MRVGPTLKNQSLLFFQNSPLYIGGAGIDTSTDNELSRQWLVHTALDALEERLASTNGSNTGTSSNAARTDLRDLYLGLLYSTDTHKMCVICRFIDRVLNIHNI